MTAKKLEEIFVSKGRYNTDTFVESCKLRGPPSRQERLLSSYFRTRMRSFRRRVKKRREKKRKERKGREKRILLDEERKYVQTEHLHRGNSKFCSKERGGEGKTENTFWGYRSIERNL